MTGCLILMESSNGWDTTGQQQVFGRSVGEAIDLIFIGSTKRSDLHPQIWIKIRMGRRIVPISLPQLAIYRSLEIFFLNHHIQFKKIITYEIKWLNEHTTKCWAWLSTNCCTPFGGQSFINNSIGLGSRPRDVTCKKKKRLQVNNKLINNIFHLN